MQSERCINSCLRPFHDIREKNKKSEFGDPLLLGLVMAGLRLRARIDRAGRAGGGRRTDSMSEHEAAAARQDWRARGAGNMMPHLPLEQFQTWPPVFTSCRIGHRSRPEALADCQWRRGSHQDTEGRIGSGPLASTGPLVE